MMTSADFLIETPGMNKQQDFSLSSSLVSELLTGIRLRGVEYRRIQTGPAFGMGFEEKPSHAYFHFLAVGTAVIRMADGELHKLSAGSVIFMPHGSRHQLLSDASTAFQDIEEFHGTPLGESVTGLDTCPSTHATPSAVIFYGCMEFDLGGLRGIGKLMPTVMLADTQTQGYPGLLPVLDSMKREICAGRVGFASILARLAEVAAAMIVRGWIECGCENASGLLAALRDPRLARAILALHRQPGHQWTVAQLAAECHVSRSVFARRFETTIGVPPLRYVTELRMHLAIQLLTQERVPIEAVALRLGYTSQAAFSRAFKRVIGTPPGASRQVL
jgi:AraC-like DNA-binding protein